MLPFLSCGAPLSGVLGLAAVVDCNWHAVMLHDVRHAPDVLSIQELRGGLMRCSPGLECNELAAQLHFPLCM